MNPQLARKVRRLGLLKVHNLGTAAGLRGVGSTEAVRFAGKLETCGTWLLLREYLDSGDVRLKGGNWCKQHLLCPLCAAARAKRNVQAYGERLSKLGGKLYMFTLTWPSPKGRDIDGLRSGIALGLSAFRKLWARRKVRQSGPLRHVAACLLSVEVTWYKAGWHPHLHGIFVVPAGRPRVDVVEFREEWQLLTGGKWIASRIRDRRKIIEGGGRQLKFSYMANLERDLVEVLKYTAKPGSLPPLQSVQLQLLLRGRRTVFTFGKLRAVPEGFSEWDLKSGESYVDWLLRWAGEHYRLLEHERGAELREKVSV